MRMENFWLWLSYRMPKALIYWCALRVAVHATTGEWAREEVDSVSIMVALDRWDRMED